MRNRLGMTQEAVANASGGQLKREEVVKIESGTLQASSYKQRAGLVAAFGLDHGSLDAYLGGGLEIDGALKIIRERASTGERVVEREERYPNRARAIEMNKSRWSVETAEQLASVALKSDNDLSVPQWTQKGDAIEARVRGKAVGVVVDTTEDEFAEEAKLKKLRRGAKKR